MSKTADYSHGEPAPLAGTGPSMHDKINDRLADTIQHSSSKEERNIVHAAMLEILSRKKFGLEKYGTILQANNGRNPLNDLIDEIGDALVYAQQLQHETRTIDERGEVSNLVDRLIHIYLELFALKAVVDA